MPLSLGTDMRRREFITLVVGAAATWPLAARAQQTDRMRRIGVLFGGPVSDDNQARLAAFLQVLQQLGWTEGRNVRIESRWGAGNADDIRKYAAELAALTPDVILASGDVAAAQQVQATRTVPIVFVIVPDPVGAGLVNSLSRPGGNATGFMQFEYSLTAKWPELLKEIAPGVKRAAVLRDAATASGIGQFAVIQYVAPSVGVEVSPIDLRDPGEIERAVTAFGRSPDGGLIIAAGSSSAVHSNLITALAARHKLPAVYSNRDFGGGGGLISYGPNFVDQYRRAAAYIDRILKGEKPTDLPVQAPTKYELVINLKIAKTLGLAVPPTLLARANEVIE
jgi:putative tryptophan/tyrosine transport system substrate-binding protein